MGPTSVVAFGRALAAVMRRAERAEVGVVVVVVVDDVVDVVGRCIAPSPGFDPPAPAMVTLEDALPAAWPVGRQAPAAVAASPSARHLPVRRRRRREEERAAGDVAERHERRSTPLKLSAYRLDHGWQQIRLASMQHQATAERTRPGHMHKAGAVVSDVARF
jgi:hypothetical protein